MIQPFHSAAKAAGRLRPSGPRNLCPVCGRNADGDCRFSENLILCHQGTRFGPPQHLRPGDVIDINGVRWALIRSDSGFDGAAHEFRPDRGDLRWKVPRRQRRKQKRQANRLLHEVIRDIDAALEVPEFMQSPPDELRASFDLIDTASSKAEALLSAMHGHTHREQFLLLKEAMRQLSYQKQDADHFRDHYLGEVRDDQ